MRLQNINLRSQIYFLVGLLLVMMLLTTGVVITKLTTLRIELLEITEDDIPLTEAITKITTNQLEQAIWFERVLRHSLNMADSEEEAQAFKHAKEEFLRLAHLVDQELKDAEMIAEEAIEKAHNEAARKEFTEIDESRENMKNMSLMSKRS